MIAPGAAVETGTSAVPCKTLNILPLISKGSCCFGTESIARSQQPSKNQWEKGQNVATFCSQKQRDVLAASCSLWEQNSPRATLYLCLVQRNHAGQESLEKPSASGLGVCGLPSSPGSTARCPAGDHLTGLSKQNSPLPTTEALPPLGGAALRR